MVPSLPTTRMASGEAITTSKFISPFLTCSASSSIPTRSAPASLASSAVLTLGKDRYANGFAGAVGQGRRATHHLIRLPGIHAKIDGDVDRFGELHAGASRKAVPPHRPRRKRFLPRSSPRLPFARFVNFAILEPLHFDTSAARATGNGAHSGFEIGGGEIRHFRLSNLFELRAGDLAHLFRVGHGRCQTSGPPPSSAARKQEASS